MGTTPFLNFEEIKAAYTIEELMDMTGLKWKKESKSFRAACPVGGNVPRSLVATPDKNDDKGGRGCFYCHSCEVGGDRVSLLAHVRQSKPYAIFKELHEARKSPPVTTPEEKEKEGSSKERSFRELPYLEPKHPAVEALGFPPEIATALGIGHAPRGHHKQRIAVPLRLADGRLIGYISLGGDVLLPPKWHL